MAEKVKSESRKTFKCPHGNTVTAEQTFGVLRYMHENGKPCHSMNRFDISGKNIVVQMAGSEMFDLRKKVVLIGFKTDRNVRTHVFKTFANMPADELADALLILIKLFRIDLSHTPLYEEMAADFGYTFRRNVMLISEGTVSSYIKTGVDKRKPKYTMLDLDRVQMKSGIEGIKDAFENANGRRKSALKGIKPSITGDPELDDLLDSLDL